MRCERYFVVLPSIPSLIVPPFAHLPSFRSLSILEDRPFPHLHVISYLHFIAARILLPPCLSLARSLFLLLKSKGIVRITLMQRVCATARVLRASERTVGEEEGEAGAFAERGS